MALKDACANLTLGEFEEGLPSGKKKTDQIKEKTWKHITFLIKRKVSFPDKTVKKTPPPKGRKNRQTVSAAMEANLGKEKRAAEEEGRKGRVAREKRFGKRGGGTSVRNQLEFLKKKTKGGGKRKTALRGSPGKRA